MMQHLHTLLLPPRNGKTASWEKTEMSAWDSQMALSQNRDALSSFLLYCILFLGKHNMNFQKPPRFCMGTDGSHRIRTHPPPWLQAYCRNKCILETQRMRVSSASSITKIGLSGYFTRYWDTISKQKQKCVSTIYRNLESNPQKNRKLDLPLAI